MYQGDDCVYRFRYKAQHQVVDLSTFVIVLECSIPELSKQAIIPNPSDGEYQFEYSREETNIKNRSTAQYEVAFYPLGLDGPKNTKYRGSFMFEKEVTND